MRLWFENSAGKARVIAKIDGRKRREVIEEEAFRAIRSFCDERNFKIYYVRKWGEVWRGKTADVYDVGSHTEFFYLTK